MSYEAPYIDEAGLHISSYNEIRDSLIEDMKRIFGSDLYLGNDSQDYQMISSFALMVYDVHQALLLAYNNNSPATAVKTGLDRIVAINGIYRGKKSYSTCPVRLTGIAHTKIHNGIISDKRGIQWSLPEQVVIGESGIAQATAVCKIAGNIPASPGDIDTIVTPTKGWIGVENIVSGIPGKEEESDSILRQKQKESVCNPSRSVFEGTIGAIANIEGVVRYAAYENDTGETVDGLPPHSITLVIDGGEEKTLANAIYQHKTPGCYTNGNVIVEIGSSYGLTTPIRFYRPDYVDLTVQIKVHRLAGYTDTITEIIAENIYAYINGLGIGKSIYTANLNGPILKALNQPPNFYVESLTAGKKNEASSSVIEIGFIEAARISMDDISIEVIS